MAILAVIPSRIHSVRFPGKALRPIAGVPLVRRVVERVATSGIVERVIVSTDDVEIARAVESTDAEVLFDEATYSCGTDRVAAAARALGWDGRVINVQGDEPLVDAEILGAAIAALRHGRLGTVATTRFSPTDLTDTNAVKVMSHAGRACCFGRRLTATDDRHVSLHIGVYAFDAPALRAFSELSPTAGEKQARLEQLRALESGWSIGVELVDRWTASVNTPSDISRVEAILAA